MEDSKISREGFQELLCCVNNLCAQPGPYSREPLPAWSHYTSEIFHKAVRRLAKNGPEILACKPLPLLGFFGSDHAQYPFVSPARPHTSLREMQVIASLAYTRASA